MKGELAMKATSGCSRPHSRADKTMRIQSSWTRLGLAVKLTNEKPRPDRNPSLGSVEVRVIHRNLGLAAFRSKCFRLSNLRGFFFEG